MSCSNALFIAHSLTSFVPLASRFSTIVAASTSTRTASTRRARTSRAGRVNDVYAGNCKYQYTADAMTQRDDIFKCLAYAAATGAPRTTSVYGGALPLARDVSLVDRRATILFQVLNLAAPIEQRRPRFTSLAREMARTLQSPWFSAVDNVAAGLRELSERFD